MFATFVTTDAFTPSQGTNPMAQSRTLAIFHAAIHDALMGTRGRSRTRSDHPRSMASNAAKSPNRRFFSGPSVY